MTFAPHHNGSRNCTRCGLPLTDAASRNEGIGPHCRKLDNALLARLIPSDLQATLAAYQTVDILDLAPESVPTFIELERAFRADDAATREDWRKEAKRVEWMLSVGQGHSNVAALKQIVTGLGYIGLVSLWDGEAATGLATITFEDGHLLVLGPRNKYANKALHHIPGAWFVKPNGEKKGGWSIPAAQYEAVRIAVITHYPNFIGLKEACEAAKATHESSFYSTATTQPEPSLFAPSVVVKQEGDILKVKTPYKAEFIAALKATCPYSSRKWNPLDRVWEVAVTMKAELEQLLTTYYPA